MERKQQQLSQHCRGNCASNMRVSGPLQMQQRTMGQQCENGLNFTNALVFVTDPRAAAEWARKRWRPLCTAFTWRDWRNVEFESECWKGFVTL